MNPSALPLMAAAAPAVRSSGLGDTSCQDSTAVGSAKGGLGTAVALAAALLGGLQSAALAQAQDQSASAQATLDPVWVQRIEQTATQAARAVLGEAVPVRVELTVGQLDPRLRLAPCAKVDVAMPAGHRPWGRTRIGLRCVQGPVAWNVTLPLTVKVHAPALVVAQSLPAGTVLQAAHLQTAEVDWAETASPVVTLSEAAVGRTLSRPVSAGHSLRQADLKQRQWFAAGDPVRIVAVGPGFAVSGEGVALSPGLEGQPARIRTESGRLLTGMPRGDRRVEVTL